MGWGSGSGSVQLQVRVQVRFGSGLEVRSIEFGFRVRFRVRAPSSVWSSGSGFGSEFGRRSCVRSGVRRVQVRASVQGSGPKFGLEFRGVQVRGSVQGSGPEFSLAFRFGVRLRVRVGAPSSVLSSGSEFGSGFCGVRNVYGNTRRHGSITACSTYCKGQLKAGTFRIVWLRPFNTSNQSPKSFMHSDLLLRFAAPSAG